MNVKRQKAYLKLIQVLLNSPDEQKTEILVANQGLFDADFLKTVEAQTEIAFQQEDKNRVSFLRNLHSYLKGWFCWHFLNEVLEITASSQGKVQVVLALLETNIEKLDCSLLEALQEWTISALEEAEPDRALSIAEVVINFCSVIQEFHLGDRSCNIEIAIAGYEVVLTVINRISSLNGWAIVQNNLAKAYFNRIQGDKAENLELAIQYYTQALEVFTRDTSPQMWASIQNSLGAAYIQKIQGNKAENIECAIKAFSAALEIRSYVTMPQQWAMTQKNLGIAYLYRLQGDRTENIELAIKAYTEALKVINSETSPQDWATIQNVLCQAYFERTQGDESENIEHTITAFTAALEVINRGTSSQDWATIQNHLCIAYFQRIGGDRAKNIENAITACTAALEVFTYDTSPIEWAWAQNALGNAYSQRMYGERATNIEIGIAAYEAALKVRTHATLPQDWATTQNGLGNAYTNRIRGERAENLELAIKAFLNALKVSTYSASPHEWGMIQMNLGITYRNRIFGDPSENLEVTITAYTEALKVFTANKSPYHWAMAQMNLGVVYCERIYGERAENLELAIAAHAAALEVFTVKTSPYNWAMIQMNLGTAYRNRIFGDPSENLELAIAAYTAALEVFTAEKSPYNWAMVQTSLGIVYYERIHGERAENLELSIAAHAEALEVFTPNTSPHDWAQVQMNLGNSYCKRIHGERAENLELAITAYNQALNVYTHQAFPKHHAAASLNLGLAYQNKKNFPSAYNTFTDAIGTVEMMREQIVSEKIKRKQSEEWNKLYRYMVEICLELEKETEAIEYAERSKTRNLVETILERDFNTIFPRDVIQILEQIRDEIATGQNKIQTGKAENTKELSQYLQELRQKRNEFQDKFLPVGYGFNLNKFQETLDERTAIIQWYITDISIEVFIITCKSQQWFKFSNRNNSLGILIDWLNNYMYTYIYSKPEWINSLFSCLKNLAEILPIEDILKLIPEKCTSLILIPHRYLHLLPLHALPLSNGELVCEKFPDGVIYAPSLQILQQIQMRKRPDFQNLFAIQNPTEDLLYTDLEVDSILNIFPTHQVLAYNQATKDKLFENLPSIQEANYLHFSCHGLFNLNSPQDSCLLLADSKDEHNNLDLSKCLTLGNLFERDFQLNNCRLVVLSACETGLVDFNNTSDEYISLPSGFLYAGATSVVSSLWTVDDLSTSLLMIKFLQNFQNEIAKDENSSAALALNQAQTWIKNATKEELAAWMSNLPLDKTWKMHINRFVNALETGSKPFESPFHWAGFIAVGK